MGRTFIRRHKPLRYLARGSMRTSKGRVSEPAGPLSSLQLQIRQLRMEFQHLLEASARTRANQQTSNHQDHAPPEFPHTGFIDTTSSGLNPPGQALADLGATAAIEPNVQAEAAPSSVRIPIACIAGLSADDETTAKP